MLLHDLEPDGIQPIVHILDLHGGNAIHIDLGVSHQFQEIRMLDHLTKQSVVEPAAFPDLEIYGTALLFVVR